MPLDEEDLPSTLQRSPRTVHNTYAKGGRAACEGSQETHGGIDAGKTKDELLEDARETGIEGRSTMNKDELVDALEKHSRRATARARG